MVIGGRTVMSLVAGALCLNPIGVADQQQPDPAPFSNLRCGGREVTIVGTAGSDTIVGTEASDVISAGDGADVISGLGGSDYICGGAGADVVNGGDGFDWLDGGAGADELSGDDDGDVVYGEGGADELDAGAGEDYLYGGTGDDVLRAGEDTGGSSCSNDIACDHLAGGPGGDLLDGGVGIAPDLVYFPEPVRDIRVNLTRGTAKGEGHDELVSIEAVNIGDLLGQTDDRVVGTDGDDVLYIGMGSDFVRSRGGSDAVYEQGDSVSSEGDDLRTGAGNDYVVANDGSDLVKTGAGADYVWVQGDATGPGREYRLGSGNDQLMGHVPDNTPYRVWGGAGDDHLTPSGYAIFLYGGRGDDQLSTDFVSDDYLNGGPGFDHGGAGEGDDTCVSIEDPSGCEH